MVTKRLLNQVAVPSVQRTRSPAFHGKDPLKWLWLSFLTASQPVFPTLFCAAYVWAVCQLGHASVSLQDGNLPYFPSGQDTWEDSVHGGGQRGASGEDSRLGPRILIGLLLVMDWEHVWHTHSLPLKVTLSPIGKGFLRGNEEESKCLLF